MSESQNSVPLTLRKSDMLDDWYLIERRNHDGRTWSEQTEYGSRYQSSARISDADVEGRAREMLGIATAIEERSTFKAKRCAVWFEGDRACFSSPRNSQRPGTVTLEDADNLAKEIREKLEGVRSHGPRHGGQPSNAGSRAQPPLGPEGGVRVHATFVRTRREVVEMDFILPDDSSRQTIFETFQSVQDSGNLRYTPTDEIDDQWAYLNDEEEPLQNTKKGP